MLFAVLTARILVIWYIIAKTAVDVSSVAKHTKRKLDVKEMFSVQTVVVLTLLLVQSVQFMQKDMRILQNNIQSVRTSLPLLKQVVQKHNVDIVLLQEIWHQPDGFLNLRNFSPPITKIRNKGEGGGVAILTNRNVKFVHLKEYEVDEFEAVWVEVLCGKVRTVVGSVYIPPGDKNALCQLDTVIGEILKKYKHLMIGMDANSRSVLWDDKCIGYTQYRKSVHIGAKLEEILDKYSLQIHNTGVSTYNSGNVSTAPDVTVSVGISDYGAISWRTVYDDLCTPHDGIIIEVANTVCRVQKEVINWRTFDWTAYKTLTTTVLKDLFDSWNCLDIQDTNTMVQELNVALDECVKKIATTKVVTSHSRPWITQELSDQLKLLRQQRKRCRLRRSVANVNEYHRIQKETLELTEKAENEWWLLECQQLTQLSESEKWKTINKLTNQPTSVGIQPIKKMCNGDTVYLFTDKEICCELEDYHITKAQKDDVSCPTCLLYTSDAADE